MKSRQSKFVFDSKPSVYPGETFFDQKNEQGSEFRIEIDKVYRLVKLLCVTKLVLELINFGVEHQTICATFLSL